MESLTNDMEEKIVAVMDKIAEAGGMFEAARTGMVQQMIGVSAAKFQDQIDSGEQTWVGINKYQEEGEVPVASLKRPDRTLIEEHLETLSRFKKERSNDTVAKSLDELTRAAEDDKVNIFAKIVDAAEIGATNGEICGRLRRDLGFGNPLVAA